MRHFRRALLACVGLSALILGAAAAQAATTSHHHHHHSGHHTHRHTQASVSGHTRT
ncbi:hypothetical protein Asru_0320_03 [Acidisphaera rubrifaciens HS-AP3]|uniref:Uncharacterized protein n=1 Tax=Acidisphaera rubrifaciens HS-AP3 TaxID=1231350 RepID=A0A0D6P8B0_9PROT|nr:hypothetical protein Asru_0320_03 [Acidisphaera rubrifaciens HS-AP3]